MLPSNLKGIASGQWPVVRPDTSVCVFCNILTVKLSCIYQWIGNKRCKRGERVLKQPTVWISIIKITN